MMLSRRLAGRHNCVCGFDAVVILISHERERILRSSCVREAKIFCEAGHGGDNKVRTCFYRQLKGQNRPFR